ncbi:hypothetical protein L6452_20473 [Arctium lappa]|uniref:Uncharacterized protein n=1 Tax=Arctium lappa TaxID=4217 RepID=A0ACB9BBG6_ARCLA|nr:hypothetical protein L6452_20473 [Arctium lappa]
MGSSSTTNKLLVRLPKQPHSSSRVPKGCLAVKVGETGAEQQRFVVPVICFNHPLFMQLLKDAEDEYGFEQKGTITIPCNVHHFRTIINRIIHHHRHRQQEYHFGCFRVLVDKDLKRLVVETIASQVYYKASVEELISLFNEMMTDDIHLLAEKGELPTRFGSYPLGILLLQH